ncbi:MAG: methyltransferase domain-containing protein [Chloroflexi bacterium]|nr:methyltransferase domain-containing protein [Chloroflexota bacterium]
MLVYLVLFIVLGVFLGVIAWQLAIWLGEMRSKNKKYKAACAYAEKVKKPLLIAGGPWGNQRLRRLLRIPAHGQGDVCLDIDRNAIEGHPNGVVANVTHIPFLDKSFGAVFASHLLEHLSTVDEARRALDELNRTADGVFIVSPSRQSLSAWLHTGHHLWVWQNGKAIYLEQRGKSAPKQRQEYLLRNV